MVSQLFRALGGTMTVFTASANQLAMMEAQLDAIGREVRKLQNEVADDRRTLATLEARQTPENAAELDASEDVRQRVGPSLVALAHQRFPEPYFVNDTTVERLDYHPRPLDAALHETVE